ncbi:MAG: nucleotide exchange factor GrpE [Clostridia bacterium]|nr:nucleotide exchange factor GrpE [Clostridia bacterium]
MKETKKKPIEEELEQEAVEEAAEDAAEEAVEETPEDVTEETPEEAPADDALDNLQKALEEEQNRYLRLMAEYDNFRKRSAREKDGIYTDAKADTFTSLLPVLDNFDRAFENEDASPEDFRKGVEMTRDQLVAVFEKAGVESYGEAGEPFDPNLHNAVSHIEDPEQGENVLAQVFQKGYKLGDKVLRHAMVVVAN